MNNKKLIKVTLLNDGGYLGMKSIKFPVIVSGCLDGNGIRISQNEMYRVGLDQSYIYYKGYYFNKSEYTPLKLPNHYRVYVLPESNYRTLVNTQTDKGWGYLTGNIKSAFHILERDGGFDITDTPLRPDARQTLINF